MTRGLSTLSKMGRVWFHRTVELKIAHRPIIQYKRRAAEAAKVRRGNRKLSKVKADAERSRSGSIVERVSP